jgi:hypothetical protein
MHGLGDILILCSVEGHDNWVITLWDVAFCPDAQDNLVSESQMDCKGLEICKQNGEVFIIKPNGDLLMQGYL